MALLCGRRDPKRKILEVQKLLIDGSKICLLECGHKQIARPQKQRFGGYRPMQKKLECRECSREEAGGSPLTAEQWESLHVDSALVVKDNT